MALTASLIGQAPAAAQPKTEFQRLKVQREHVVPVGPADTAHATAADPAAGHSLKGARPAPQWPGPGAATVDVGPSDTKVPGMAPVRLGPGAARLDGRHGPAPSRVTVRVLDRAATAVRRPDAVLLRVSRADGGTAAGPVHVALDYSGFRSAYGADWARRLRLVALPECALTTPGQAGCQGTPLASANDGTTVSAEVSAAAGAGTLLAATASPSGSSGTFAATTLSASGAWSQGGSSGDFSWSYALRVPPGLGGPSPQLSLAYSAQSVDGRHAASNNQPSWVGEGFEMWSGYVERRYKPCGDDGVQPKTGDQCWATDNATMSLGGRASELIRDDATGTWHPKSDDGSKIEHLTGGANGDDNGEYWKVTTANGTQYWFGLNRLPGWTSGRPETNSTWTVPVFGDDAGEPCHQATFDASWCRQAWRWNLDYVVDPHGNSMSYRYGTETNMYARDLDPAKSTSYERGGYLTEIDYGTRTEAEYGNAPARVLFTVADRCLPNTTCDSAHPANWPDVPWDQSCTGTSCTLGSPTFFTTKRLAKVTTQVWGASAYRDVESWTLNHTYPDPGDGTRAGLWLASISHSGLVGGTLTVPDVTFTGVQMPNRVDTVDHSPAMNWWRIASIRTETGGEISVRYSGPDCVAGSRMPSAPETNTLRCYPVKWTPPGYTAPVTDYFHKYVVAAVSETDHTGGAPRVQTLYDYIGAPAWHYTDDDGLIPDEQKTWSVWRGYAKIGVTKGDPGEQSYGETLYFRGMDGDHLPSGTRSVSVTDSRGGTWTDSDPLAGMIRERVTFDGPGGAEVSSMLTDPWMSAPTATRVRDGVTTKARYVNTGATLQRIALDGGRGYRQTKSVTKFDQYGAAIQTDDYGDVDDPGDDQCTKYNYARNTTSWLLTLTSRVQTYALSCDKTPTSADQVIGDTRTCYDGQAWGAAPTKGDVTRVESLKDWSGGVATFMATNRMAYDAYGRVTDSWDVDGDHTTTAYTPATGGPVTRNTVTNPLGWTTVSDLEPAWGVTTGTTDANGRRTDVGYDALGRVTGVWLPGRAKGTQPASTTYGYLIRTDGPAAVTTSTLNAKGGYTTSYALYDGLLRPRQTQAPAVGPDGGRIVTDTFYDTAGRAYKTDAAYVADGTPGTGLFTPAGDNQIPAQTLTLFDGADRPTASVFRSLGVEKWRTTTSYGGDHVDVTPPPGGIATSTVTDARGRTVESRQYHGPTPSGAHDATKYAYNAKNLLASVTDTAGNQWTYGYDVRGRQVRVDDPDKGTTTAVYDDAGRVLSTTDARGRTLTYTYDALDRKTAVSEGSTKLAEWTYDTLVKGQVASSTRWSGGNAYTTAVTGYDVGYRASGTKITVPASEGALAGTYQFATTYKANGSVATTTMPAAGGLPQETLGVEYTDTGQPLSLGGTTTYVTQAQYTRLGEPAVLTFQAGGPLAQLGYYYEESTRRLERTLAVRETSPSTIADQRITWDPSGNITKVADTPAGGASDTQCFTYDYQRRLTEAWTPSSGDCAPTPSAAGLGGPAPYWQSFRYDVVGNRTSSVDHAVGGDTTTSLTYPAPGSARPHAAQSVTTTTSAGSKTVSLTYDASGNTTARPTATDIQKLTWDAEGRLADGTDSGGTTSYVYDVDGARLVRHDATGATLYLPGMELRLTTATGTLSGTRYYSFGGSTIAQRTGGGITWLMPDRQGTALVAVEAGTQAVTQRRQKPFGEPRGASVSWPNEHGYVGGTDEPTGLTHLGAREYDPVIGRFVSPDPVFDSANPQQMASYAYAGNNPVAQSDPSGLWFLPSDDSGVKASGPAGPDRGPGPTQNQPPPSHPAPTEPSPPPACEWWNIGCNAQQAWNATVNFAEQHKAQIVGIITSTAVGVGCGLVIGWTGVGAVACGFVAGAAGAIAKDLMEGGHSAGQIMLDALVDGSIGALTGGLMSVGGAALKAGATAMQQGIKAAGQAAGKAMAEEVADIFTGKITSGLLGNAAKNATKNVVQEGANCLANSFTPATTVLMADGSAKAIAAVEPGDEVKATDPETGKTVNRRVTATISGEGEKNLVDITIDTDGSRGDKTGHVVATDGHPFWVPDLRQWVDAGRLRPGMLLRTSAGTYVRIQAIKNWTARQRVHNLTIDGLHTYYALAKNIPLLAHNCGPELYGVGDKQFGSHWGNHSKHYNMNPGDRAARQWYMDRIYEVRNAPDQIRRGPWSPRGNGGDGYWFFLKGNDLLLTKADGKFVSMFPYLPLGNNQFDRAARIICNCT
ncbi:RHS repeat-associated core domain-containing protein [Microbispora sp. H10670]|uniref:RHS repeat-associated core domain-containing protein n=1 Tax=Microbispora sp. H10670 TaxID=2729108 RepID=UPI0016004307|nr:RHS repeat-associated core domain-containing protein [Microbispora sp. H10670]